MQILNRVTCGGATAGGTGSRTRIRIIQYAIYGDRGVWISKKLRSLWKPGCDVGDHLLRQQQARCSTSCATGPGEARSRCGSRSTKNRRGNIVKYNHSKWMTIIGALGKLDQGGRT